MQMLRTRLISMNQHGKLLQIHIFLSKKERVEYKWCTKKESSTKQNNFSQARAYLEMIKFKLSLIHSKRLHILCNRKGTGWGDVKRL